MFLIENQSVKISYLDSKLIRNTMMMRERSVRKAKEKAVEHLHEITSNYYKGANSTTTTPKRKNKPPAHETTPTE